MNRLNEIAVSITYHHNKSSFLNTKDLKVRLAPFIRHGKFVSFRKIFEKTEGHMKKQFVAQIPSLIKQKFLKTKQKIEELNKQGVKQLISRSGATNELDDA